MAGKNLFRKNWIKGLAVGFVGAVLALALWGLGWLDTWEAKTWDWRVAFWAEPGKATDDIRLILLDQSSLDWAQTENGLSWPWPREVYAAVVNYCRRSGARALAFDVLYTEPSKYGVEDDAALGAAVAEFGHLAGSVFLSEKSGAETRWPSGIPVSDINVAGLNEWLNFTKAKGITFPRASLPIPDLARSAAVLSNVHLDPDPDGIYRRIKPFGVFDDNVLPILGLGTYLAGNPNKKLKIESQKLVLDDKVIPLDRQGNVVLRYRGKSGTHKTYSAAAVLQSEIRMLAGQAPTIRESNAFKDKYVFFGFSAPGLFDLRSTPVDGVYPGVEIHATLLDNFLSGDFMRNISAWMTAGLIFVLALTCGVLATVYSSPFGSVAVGFVFCTIPVCIAFGSYFKGFWVPLAVQETAALSTMTLALVLNYATEGRQKRFIKSAFKHYLSPAVIEQLIRQPDRLKLGGERRILSIFFSDLQGFTSISEGLDPEELTALLNDYLSVMTEIIQEENGTVDKYEGDAIIAFWNAPLEVPEHAVRAVQAALRCQASLAKMRPGFRDRIGKDMFMRIGINTGPAVVGNMGSHTRFNYTMLGDAVNLAARLEGVNKQFGTYTVISRSTRDMVRDAFAVRELARVAVVGRKEAVTIFEPMLSEAFNDRKELFETFARGLELFYLGDFRRAVNVFASIQNHDAPAAAYAQKCRALLNVPPEDWQGVWTMTDK